MEFRLTPIERYYTIQVSIYRLENDMDIKRFHKINTPYDQLPWYRKRWFVFITLLLFPPAAIVIALTGKVYAQSNGEVYLFKQAQINHILFFATAMIGLGLFRVLNA